MFKVNTILRRLYHDNPISRTRDPVVRPASKRVGEAIRRRQDAEAKPRYSEGTTARTFQPFPFAVTEENKFEVIRNKTTPLLSTPYTEQLAIKEAYCRNSLRHIAQQIYETGTPIRLDVERLPCHINPIVATPQLFHYRNMDEFSIWRGVDGVTNTVGYNVFPISKHGDTICVEPHGCVSIKGESIKFTDILQEFIRNQAKLPVCYTLSLGGGWRKFIVRSNLEGELMAIGVLNPRTLRLQDLMEEKENFKDFVVQRSQEANLQLKSVYFQPCPHISCPHSAIPYELLHGQKHITETINNFKILISPETFLHQNTKGSEFLFENVKKVLEDCFSYNKATEKKPLVILSRCGTGIMAFHLAELASKVVGVDHRAQAIEDARANAELNGIKNSEFIQSQFEMVLEELLEKYSSFKQETLVVCYAPKVGLDANIIKSLRQCADVKKVIYITPRIGGDGAIDDIVKFCMKNSGKAPPPFALVSATPVDVLPHVEACETMVVLERLSE